MRSVSLCLVGNLLAPEGVGTMAYRGYRNPMASSRVGRASWVALVIAHAGCSDRFECGDQGGTCGPGEVCVLGPGECSTCNPAPASCGEAPTCDCLPSLSDTDLGERRCVDGGSCSDEDGVVVTCEAIDWSCG